MKRQKEHKVLGWGKALCGVTMISTIPGIIFGMIAGISSESIRIGLFFAAVATIITIPFTAFIYSIVRIITHTSAPDISPCTAYGIAIGLVYALLFHGTPTLLILFFPVTGGACGLLFYYFFCKPVRGKNQP